MAMSDSPSSTAIEVEQKFRLADPDAFADKLRAAGATEQATEHHADTYYRHPARDFAQTREALRIRRVCLAPGPSAASETFVTYKGPYSATGVKARPELEWRLDPGDPNGDNLDALFHHLGFATVLTVRKSRRPFVLTHAGFALTVTIDDAQQVGTFAEIETIALDPSDVEACRSQISQLADQLDLRCPEQKSYLTMALELVENTPQPS